MDFSERLKECLENEYLKYGHKTEKDKYRNFVFLSYLLKCIEDHQAIRETYDKINNLK